MTSIIVTTRNVTVNIYFFNIFFIFTNFTIQIVILKRAIRVKMRLKKNSKAIKIMVISLKKSQLRL